MQTIHRINQIINIKPNNLNNVISNLNNRLRKVGLFARFIPYKESEPYLIIEDVHNIRKAGAKRNPLIDESGNIVTCADIFKRKSKKQSNQIIASSLLFAESHHGVSASTIGRRIKYHRANHEFREDSTIVF